MDRNLNTLLSRLCFTADLSEYVSIDDDHACMHAIQGSKPKFDRAALPACCNHLLTDDYVLLTNCMYICFSITHEFRGEQFYAMQIQLFTRTTTSSERDQD